MDYTIHPDPSCAKSQADFLASCRPEEKHINELLFKYGNVVIHYHQKSGEFKPSHSDWKEWIEGLGEPMKTHFRNDGFEKCKGVLSFTRYVNEKNDIGLVEFVKQHMDPKEYAEIKDFSKSI